VRHVEFQIFDSDNHYYEARDAFTRYGEPGLESRTMQWAQLNGKDRLLVAGKVNRFIPNPTFDPIAQPGSMDEYFRGRNPKRAGTKELFGELEPLASRPEYRDRDARLRLMDEQGIQGAIFLPTLGVGMEQALIHDPPALVAAFRAFNRWLEEDWGFAHQQRIFAAPILTLVDPVAALEQVRWSLAQDARFLLMVPGPVMTASGGGRTPASSDFDSVWAAINEAGVTLVMHGGDTRYSTYLGDWGERPGIRAFQQDTFSQLVSLNATQDTLASMISSRLFSRFPNLRVACVETGSDWVLHLFKKMKKSFGQTPFAYDEDPRETFRRHVWVSPYYEDDLAALRDAVGTDRMLMGSDFPHVEGLAEPSSYINDLAVAGFSAPESERIMRWNGLELATPRPL
jgi:predicted TIM-barrel fold metal-dependent hydrolase